MRRVAALLVFVTIGADCYGQHVDDLRNWFNDPFFQVSNAIPNCPLPAGPFIDERAMRSQSHRRAEKGTTCWLAGDCDRQNSYLYDTDIANAFLAAVGQDGPYADTTLWITVQGRVAYLQGCAMKTSQRPVLEAFARSIPYVEQAFVELCVDSSLRVPYRVRQAQ